MNVLNLVGIALMAAGAASAYVLTVDVPGFVVDPAWKVALGAFLAANGVVLRYLPPAGERPQAQGEHSL